MKNIHISFILAMAIGNSCFASNATFDTTSNQYQSLDLQNNQISRELAEEIAKLRLQVDKDRHENYQRSVLSEQSDDVDDQIKKRHKDANERCIAFFEREAKIAAAKADQDKAKLKSEKIKVKMEKAKLEKAKVEAEHALAEAEKALVEVEHAFRQCLCVNLQNSELGSSGIPKVCENLAKKMRLLGASAQVDELIEEFKQ